MSRLRTPPHKRRVPSRIFAPGSRRLFSTCPSPFLLFPSFFHFSVFVRAIDGVSLFIPVFLCRVAGREPSRRSSDFRLFLPFLFCVACLAPCLIFRWVARLTVCASFAVPLIGETLPPPFFPDRGPAPGFTTHRVLVSPPPPPRALEQLPFI